MKFTLILIFCFASFLCFSVTARPQIQEVPDQVRQFLQQTFFSQFQEEAEAEEGGIDNARGVISHIANLTSSHHQQNSEGVTTVEPVQEEFKTESPTTISTQQEEDVETTTSFPKESDENKTQIDNFLDQDAIAKLIKLCPELGDKPKELITQYRYYERNETCFKYGYKGQCGKGMKMYIKEYGSIYGQCECRVDNRMYLYREESNSCYKIFSQGDCPEDHYLDITSTGKVFCAVNPCSSNGTSEFYKLKGICTEIGKSNADVCKGNEKDVVDFTINRRTPHCRHPSGLVTAVGILPCSPGNTLAFHGKCQATEWEFGEEDD